MLLRSRWIFTFSLLLVIGCHSGDPEATEQTQPAPVASYAIDAHTPSSLRSVIAPMAQTHPDESGFRFLTNGTDALAGRLSMIRAAERSLDLQYYSMEDDVTGKLILEAVLRAAERGVRVRILVDDLSIKGDDDVWPLLDSHRNIEIRVFNPFAKKDDSLITRAEHVFTRLDRFMRRMHNKVMIADNQVAITGGRNIGDAYFDASSDFNFRDVDVIAAGPIAARMSHSFDNFWNGKDSFPIARLEEANHSEQALHGLRDRLQAHWNDAIADRKIADDAALTTQLKNKQMTLIWAQAELAADAPSKIRTAREDSVSKPASSIEKLGDNAQHEFLIVSPYFVPGDEGTAWLDQLMHRGVQVRVLTNSLGSTDVVAVHSGYARYRETLVAGGADMYELQPVPGHHPRSGHFASSSKASLHTKMYIIDRSDIVIGTFNLDPRSIELNTEIALVIHSSELAQQVGALFDRATQPANSFHVVLAHPGSDSTALEWIGEENGEEVHYSSDPKTGFWRPIKSVLFSLLPVEDEL